MSYSTSVRLTLLFLCCFLSACEDTKKGVAEKNETVSEATTSENTSEEIQGERTKITSENMVQFLTDYGAKHPETKARIITPYGDIELELYTDTPLHRANFVYLVKNKYFHDTFFHRVVPNFIIQAGNSDLRSTNAKRFELGNAYLLPAEINNRTHFYGSISGAKEYRENPDKKSAPHEFFIFLGPKTSKAHLDGNYTVFAKVTKGMNVVESIAKLPADEGQWPLQNVYISIELID